LTSIFLPHRPFSEYKVIGSLNLLNLTQNVIISLGLLVGSLIVADRVVKGKASPSEFVVRPFSVKLD
jgi:ABC-type transport system involved in Fe-S cluster assembly fused permease/ATPase subunit